MDPFDRMAMSWASTDKILETCDVLEKRHQLDPIHLDRVKDAMNETDAAPNTKEAQERLYPALADFMEACVAASDVAATKRAYQAYADLLRALPVAGHEELPDT